MASGRKPDQRWAQLRRLGVEFSTARAKDIGLSATVLSQAVARGQIERIERGRYRFATGQRPPNPKSKRTTRAPLRWLRFENFGVFADAEFNFCPGINVLVGENGTGKSHAMQAAYSILRAFHKGDSSRGVAARVEEKLRGVFRPEERRISRLVRRARGGNVARIAVESGAFSCDIRFNNKTDDSFELVDLRRRPDRVLDLHPEPGGAGDVRGLHRCLRQLRSLVQRGLLRHLCRAQCPTVARSSQTRGREPTRASTRDARRPRFRERRPFLRAARQGAAGGTPGFGGASQAGDPGSSREQRESEEERPALLGRAGGESQSGPLPHGRRLPCSLWRAKACKSSWRPTITR